MDSSPRDLAEHDQARAAERALERDRRRLELRELAADSAFYRDELLAAKWSRHEALELVCHYQEIRSNG